MAFTEAYVKVASAAWVNSTVYAAGAQVVGSDGKNYYCISAHTSETGVKGRPVDGTAWATYWAVSDGTTEVRAWTFAEMIAAAPAAGTRVNIKAGAYSEGATTLPSSGTAMAPIVLRGYNATIGDLDNQGRGSDGMLNTANMPDVTITGAWVPSPHCYLQNLDITGALSSALISDANADFWGLMNCRLVNSQNNAAAVGILADNGLQLINCDLSCTGASHGYVVDCDVNVVFNGCVFAITLNTATTIRADSGFVLNSVFIGTGNTSIALLCNATAGNPWGLSDCTFYNFGTAIRTPNVAPTSALSIVNCHVTDCAKYIDNLYSATAEIATIEFNNRTRDNTTPRTGVLVAGLSNEVTTDAGDYTTDYISNTNLRLKSTAAGKGVGMMPYSDIGAYQCAYPTLPAAANIRLSTGTAYGYPDAEYDGTISMPNSGTPTGTEDATSDACVVSGKNYGAANARTGSAAGGGGVIVIDD